jgi:hypothetical protein
MSDARIVAQSTAALGPFPGRVSAFLLALCCSVLAGAMLVAIAGSVSPTFRVLPEHYPFAGASMGFCLRFVWLKAAVGLRMQSRRPRAVHRGDARRDS